MAVLPTAPSECGQVFHATLHLFLSNTILMIMMLMLVHRQGSRIRPVEVPTTLGGVGTGPGGISKVEWQQRRQDEQLRAQQRTAQEEEHARQLVEASDLRRPRLLNT
jgi:hypothetical protein